MENIFKDISNKQLLEVGLREIGSKWGHYCKYNHEVTRDLIQAGFIADLRRIEHGISDPGKRKGFYTKTTLASHPNQMILTSEPYFPIFNQQRFFKKGKLLKIRPKNNVSIVRAKKEKLLEVADPALTLVGYDWQGSHSGSREFRVASLYDRYRAEVVTEYLEEKGIKLDVQPYLGKPEVRGVNLIVRGVPSLTSNKTYAVILHHIAAYKDDLSEAIPTSFDLKETHATSVSPCQKPLWYVVKDSRGRIPESILDPDDERGGDEIYLDQHVQIAFIAAEKYLNEQGYKVFNPFITLQDLGTNSRQFFENSSRVRKEVVEDGKIKRVPLTNLEKEISAWDLKRYNNYPYLKRKGLV